MRRAIVIAAVFVSGCATLPPDEPSDPLETVNRGIYKFNDTADRYVLKPVAKRYVEYVPSFIRTGVHNFLSNLAYPTVIVNDLLQGKVKQGADDFARLFVNTTVGLGGLFDVATQAGLPAHDEDFGQTLGYYGLEPGWFLMLPLLGPSNGRDLVGRAGDYFTDPLNYVEEDEVRWSVTAVAVVDLRAGLLPADRFIEDSLDPYIALRTAYLERRRHLVYDGNPPPVKYDFGEE